MMNGNGQPPALRSVMACLPDWFRNYAALHMDTLGKVINHLLIFMACCNFVLFFGAWNVSLLPLPTGINTIIISMLLCGQNACCFYIYNHGRIRNAPQFLHPSELMIGLSIGITIGGTIVAWIVSKYFHNLSKCSSSINNNNDTSSATQTNALNISEYICQHISARRTVNSVSFWSGLVFWLEFCLTLLVIMGRHDLINNSRGGGGGGGNYQDLSVDDQDENFRRMAQQQQQQQQQQSAVGGIGNSIIGTFADNGYLPTSSFVGNYTSVPETRSNASPSERNENTGAGSSQSVATTHTPLGNV